MVSPKSVLLLIGILIALDVYAEGADSPSGGNSDDSNIPIIASGKRQHNIMRFGKRPAGGHNLIHFGKRGDSKSPQHSFLYFGKRDYDEEPLNNMIQYLRNRENSYKRGHTIMRFGKRSDNGVFDDDDVLAVDGGGPDDAEEGKRSGHSMLYFGKRGGHSMMYFGKRSPGHNKLFFGKRDDDYDDSVDPLDKRAHSMIHFGKREFDGEEEKRGSHAMIHFGKRDFDEPIPFFWSPEASEKRQHNYLRFGKKTDGLRKGSHSMIHFGKRDEDKRAHSMIHFGKRSVDLSDRLQASTNVTAGSNENAKKHLSRMKRDATVFLPPEESLSPFVTYEDIDAGEKEFPDMDFHNIPLSRDGNFYPPDEAYPLQSLESDDSVLSLYPEYNPTKKGDSKNVFLRFG